MSSYSKLEKGFIGRIAENITDLPVVSFTHFRYDQFKPLLSASNRERVAQQLTRAQIAEIHAHIGKQPTAEALLKALEKRGIQLVPLQEAGTVNGYAMQYYPFPEGRIPVNGTLSKALLNTGFNEYPKPVTPQYALLVRLYQSLDKKDAAGIDNALTALEKRNPPLADQLKKGMMAMLETAGAINDCSRDEARDQSGQPVRSHPEHIGGVAGGHGGNEPAGNFITFSRALSALTENGRTIPNSQQPTFVQLMTYLIDTIQQYPSDSLKELRAIEYARNEQLPNGIIPTPTEEKSGQRGTIGDMFHAAGDISGPDSHHRKNKKKKKRLDIY